MVEKTRGLNLITKDGFCVMQKLRGTKALVLERRFHPSHLGLLSLTSGGRKIKKDLMKKD